MAGPNILERLARPGPAGTAGQVLTRAANQATRPRGGEGGEGGGGEGGGGGADGGGGAGGGGAGGGGAGGGGGQAAPAAPAPGLGMRALQAVGRGFAWMTKMEQGLTSLLPLPAIPGVWALRVGDPGLGTPHAHAHPPNLPPPPPVPLPSMVTVIPIPILSGAMTTNIEKMPAARCGDLGLAAWCGGYFPMSEVFLGSSSVWIEGCRAGRVGIDILKHCIFTSPKPQDPPIGPMIGMTLFGAGKTYIGGFPMPSLVSLAIGAAFKALFKAAGKGIAAARAAWANRASNYVDNVFFHPHTNVFVNGSKEFQQALRRDLIRLARTRSGRELLQDLLDSNQTIHFHSPQAKAAEFAEFGPHASAHNYADSIKVTTPDPNGSVVGVFSWDPHAPNPKAPGGQGDWVRDYQGGALGGQRQTIVKNGPGSGTDVVYDPVGGFGTTPGTPSERILGHELNHARNNAYGRGSNHIADPSPQHQAQYQDLEEPTSINWENDFAQETGLPPRYDYTQLAQ